MYNSRGVDNMAIKICKACGKQFEGTGTASYCNNVHYSTCEVCGKSFVIDPRNVPRCCSSQCKAILRKQSISKSVKVCELCGETFTSSSNTARYCNRDHYRPCPVCGKPVLIERGKEYEPAKCCSIDCTNMLRAQTCEDKYGVKIASQAESIRKKLHDIAVDDAVVQRRKLTSLDNWGVDNPAKCEEVKAKISVAISSKECQDKIRETTRRRYGVDFAMQCEEGLKRYSESVQQKYGVPYFCMADKCKEAQGNIISTINRQFGRMLSEHGLSYKFETRINDKSYDIHILDSKILLEVNPTYTHNSIGNHWDKNGMDKYYHLNKTKLAVANGYRCIHIFDWDDLDKVIQTLLPKKVVYPRSCTVAEIDYSTASKFEMQYHLQGDCRGQSVCLGLYYEGELVQVMTFGKPRYTNKYQWEVLRLCTHSEYRVVGGAGKLFKHFLRQYNPQSIVSYCDLAKFNGDVYQQLGFKHVRDTEPQKV